jgi:hypothetical protein
MPPVGFEPAIPVSERPQTHALDRTATGIYLSIIVPEATETFRVRKNGTLEGGIVSTEHKQVPGMVDEAM